MNIDSLLLLDNHSEMINSLVGDYHVWYGIRYQIFNKIIAENDNLTIPVSVLHLGMTKFLKYLWLTLKKFPYFIKQKEIIFFSSNVVNMNHDGCYINRLYDFFFSLYKNSAVIFEDAYRREYRTPRRQTVFYCDMIYIVSALVSKFIVIPNRRRRELTGIYLNIKSKINYNLDDKFWDDIFIIIQKQYKRYLVGKKIYFFLLKRIQPKIIFREDGSYGAYQALSTVCNRLNIVYAEFQHGFVSKNHPAYNYGEVFIESAIAKCLLPKYFLTFGRCWSEQIRIPGKKIEVGFPFLKEKSILVKSRKQCQSWLTVLVVSDASLPEFYADLVKKLANEKGKHPLRIIFKLHPVEVPLLKTWYGSLMTIENVIIKTYESVYDIMIDVDIVVGCASTVMFEALQFSYRPFVYVNDYSKTNIDYSYFYTFNDVDDLLEQIREGKYIVKKQDIIENVSYIWEQNPKECFQGFINKILDEKALA
jgi:hypothetical protein